MEDHILKYLNKLNDRLHTKGFSWWVDDYSNMRKALPEVLKILQLPFTGRYHIEYIESDIVRLTSYDPNLD